MSEAQSGDQVTICEVGPRDGLQLIQEFMPTAAKMAFIDAIAAAGMPEVEAASYVPVKVVPQFSDAAEVVAHAMTIPGLHVSALVPNLKGAERAVEVGCHAVVLPLSVSRGHSLANVRRTPEEMVDAVRAIRDLLDATPEDKRPELHVGLATAFGCSIDGEVPETEVCRLADAVVAAGADEIALADTVGYANPAQVRRLVPAVRKVVGEAMPMRLHLHDTYGLALANALAGLDCGIRTFDSALSGLGGCPFAPGASGNVVTEDLVYMCERMGLATGIDVAKLDAARQVLARNLPDEPLHGHIPQAGLPKTFVAAAAE
jgi:hydroxymethylglutaryl-CoA lyase